MLQPKTSVVIRYLGGEQASSAESLFFDEGRVAIYVMGALDRFLDLSVPQDRELLSAKLLEARELHTRMSQYAIDYLDSCNDLERLLRE